MNRAGRSLLIGIFLVGFGCAHHPTVSSNAQDGAPGVPLKEVESFHVNDPQPPEVVDQELESIPNDVNPMVQQWVRYFQGKGRSHMERYLARSTRYMTLMKQILRQNGLPEDLIYIALIESGFSPKATSRAAAVGYWQFIKGTGRRYGLEVNALVDERRDPVLATQAAAEYFKGLYSVFGSWHLAMASYNVGENRVKREVIKHFTRDFWELARLHRLPKETVNYVPKFIAAKLIGKNPAKYGFTDIDYETPIEFEMIKVDKPLNLRQMASKMNMEYEDFKQLNPKFRGEVAPVKNSGVLELRVPAGQSVMAQQAARESIVDKVELIADAGDTQTYKVRRGDSVATIARHFKTSVSVIRDINDLKPGRKLRVGMRLQVPERTPKRAKVVIVAKQETKIEKADDQEKATSNPEIVKNGSTFYVVQPGDTLTDIADDYDSSVKELRRMNKLGKRRMLKVGMRLKVPKDEGLPADPEAAPKPEVAKLDASDVPGINEDSKDEDSVTSNAGSTNSDAPMVTDTALVKPEAKEAATTEAPAAAAAAVAATTASPTSATASAKTADSQVEISEHVVRPGENLTSIAKKYGVSIQALRKANNLRSRTTLRNGARLVIPQEERADKNSPGASDQGIHQPVTATRVKMVALRRKPAGVGRAAPVLKLPEKLVRARDSAPVRVRSSQAVIAKKKFHVVRPGENLTQIAAHYGVSLESLTRKNKLRSASKVFVGARLMIPFAEAAN